MRFSISRSLLLLACLVLVSLSSCSFGNASTPANDNMTLKVAITAKSATNLPLYVALEKGYFKAEGLTLTPLPWTALGNQMVAAMQSNQYELCAGGIVTDLFTLSRVSGSIKLIGELQQAYSADITIGQALLEQSGLSVSSPLEDRVKALVGKKIGVLSVTGGTHAILSYLFKLFNLGDVDKQVTLQVLGNDIPGAVAALKSGRVDALSMPTPSGQLAEAQKVGTLWISPARNDIPSMVGQLNGVFYAKQTVIDAKPNSLKAFVRAIATAQAFIQAHPDEAGVILQKTIPSLSNQSRDAVMETAKNAFPANPRITEQSFKVATDFHVKSGLIAAAPAYDSIVNRQVADDALNGFTPKI